MEANEKRRKASVLETIPLIPYMDYLTREQAVLYMGRGSSWFEKMAHDFHIVKTGTGYYKKSDLDRIKMDEPALKSA